MNIWEFFDNHWFIAWCALWLGWAVYAIVTMLINLVGRTMRFAVVAVRGWPPAHLDADGDWKPVPEVKS